jgi:diguanylate cyclase (GGDEF)-like protein
MTKLLFWQAKHDTLTKLPNRISFEERAQSLIFDASKHESTHAMCFLDLDQFKIVNDTCGHAVGDELLRKVTAELLEGIDSEDMLARLGGDEFGVLLAHCNLEEANATATKLCEKVKNYHFVNEDHSFDIGVSIGVVAITHESQSVDQLMRYADLACYAAKEAGRNRVQIYRDTDEALNLRKGEMTWVSGILKALKENRIIIYSQKIGAVAPDSSYTHHEILVRLIDDNGEIRASYEKLHMFDVDVEDKHHSYRESDTFEAGEAIKLVDTPIGRVGLSICYDVRFPHLYSELRRQGADIIVVPAAFTKVTGRAHWDVLLRARAIETQCWVIAAAQWGEHNAERETWGHSMIIDPWGSIDKEQKEGTGVLVSDIDIEMSNTIRQRMPITDHVRFESSIKLIKKN